MHVPPKGDIGVSYLFSCLKREQSGKKARHDARGSPSLPDAHDLPASSEVPAESSAPPPSGSSYHRPRPHAPPTLLTDPGPLPPASSTQNYVASFDADTFDLANDSGLAALNSKELRALCAKFGVDTTRKNEDMVSRLRCHRRELQNRRQPRPLPPPSSYPNAYPYYSSYPYFQIHLYPGHPPQQPP
ncbi:hypothetical protein B0H11DRAFT_1901311 [Mycena galericulata]|nr:hypothetical protein B0H11DRAFT_2296419 [Mycena galericulata]KAJ7509169.1 hypothetical protein B0H11DRAFT_1901311 [Mycena galericulata]